MVTLPQVLQPSVVNGVVSELKLHNTRLQEFFGAAGATQMSGRYFAWDIFNASREVAGGRSPGTAPSRIARQKVGTVQGQFPRVHESLPLLYEQIHNQRALGGLSVDRGGEQYILKQEQYLAQRLANHLEYQFAGMIRGHFYFTQVGDDLIPSLDSGAIDVDYKIPAGNTEGCDMVGDGDILGGAWQTSSTDIEGELLALNDAMEKLSGLPLEHVWINALDWKYILQNTKLQAAAGTSNRIFETFERRGQNDLVARLAAIPWLEWHITSGVLNLNGTRTSLIPRGKALFCPTPSPEWIQVGEGSEIVIEYPGATPTERFGSYSWAEPTTKPAGYELTNVCNRLPFLYVPSALVFGTITNGS